jgi:hypothetical protein
MNSTRFAGGMESPPVPPETLKEILSLTHRLRQIGAWPDAKQRCWDAYHEWRKTRQQDAIGAMLMIDEVADDVSALVGSPRDVCRRTARTVFCGTRAEIVLAELRRCVLEFDAAKPRRRAIA